MNVSDPIADMLTRIRNASRAHHLEVVVPASRVKREIARILVEEGFIASFSEGKDELGVHPVITLHLKYVDGKASVVSGLKRISKPGSASTPARRTSPGSWAAWASSSSAPARGS